MTTKMIVARESFPRFTPEEYFEREEQQQIRHEDVDGEVYADKIATDIYSKDELGKWDITNYRSEELISLKSINLSFLIEIVYRNISFGNHSLNSN